jgi:hypothetical protein
MAKGRGVSTGRGNYAAARLGVSYEMLKRGIEGAPKVNHPNKHMTTPGYKTGLKKVEEGNEE